ERMGNHCDRQVGDAERLRLRASEYRECRRAHRDGRKPALRPFYAVVDTPRRGGASVARAGDDDVALLREAGQHVLRDGYLAGLAMLDHARDAVALDQDLCEIVDEVVEVGLGVVDETDHGAAEAFERAPR